MANYGRALGGLIGLGVTLAVTDSILHRSGLKRKLRRKRRKDYYYNYFW